MADTFTPLLRFIMQQDMQNDNQWGGIFNSAVTDLVEEAIAGKVAVDLTLGNVTLSSSNGLSDESRRMFIEALGNPGATRRITVPSLTKLYAVGNNTNPTFPIEIATATSAAIEITQAQSPTIVFVDSANDIVQTLGRADAIPEGIPWVSMPLFEDTVGGLVVTASYTKQGDYTTLFIPTFSHTFTGNLMALRAVSGAGALPTDVQYIGSTVDVAWAEWVDDSGNGLVPAHFVMGVATARLQWIDADPANALFTVGGTRAINYGQSFTYVTGKS
jgi:hypothetical protein